MLHDSTVAKLLNFAATGQAAEAHRYLGHILARDSDLAPIREDIKARIADPFYVAMLDAIPWLASDKFMPKAPQDDSPAIGREPLRERLAQAGAAGVRKLDVVEDPDFAELDGTGELADFSTDTGGRPRAMVRLKIHDPRFNPFALQR